MAFRVEVSPRAFEDLDAIADYIREHGSFERAEKWFDEMMTALTSLREMPHRCSVAEESADLGREVRVLLQGKRNHMYKVFFSIREESSGCGTVQIFHVRHWAQRRLTLEEFDRLLEETNSRPEF
jgi:plasmid stabilization system protein ParE